MAPKALVRVEQQQPSNYREPTLLLNFLTRIKNETYSLKTGSKMRPDFTYLAKIQKISVKLLNNDGRKSPISSHFFGQKFGKIRSKFPPNRTEPNRRKNTESPNRTEPNRIFGRFLMESILFWQIYSYLKMQSWDIGTWSVRFL